jgi:hypothetical protein
MSLVYSNDPENQSIYVWALSSSAASYFYQVIFLPHTLSQLFDLQKAGLKSV